MDRNALVQALKDHAQQALQKLEEYKAVEREYRQAVKALAVFEGTAVNGTAKGKPGPKAAGAGAKTARVAPGGGKTNREIVLLALTSHPEGLTIAEMAQIVSKARGGVEVTSSSIHSALREMGRKYKTAPAGPGKGPALKYSLA